MKPVLSVKQNNCGISIPQFTDLINNLQKFIPVAGSHGCNECICGILMGEVPVIV
jgi:hypothetical protein